MPMLCPLFFLFLAETHSTSLLRFVAKSTLRGITLMRFLCATGKRGRYMLGAIPLVSGGWAPWSPVCAPAVSLLLVELGVHAACVHDRGAPHVLTIPT